MKKNFKKVISSLLVAVMILTAAPLSGFVGLNFDWLDFSTKSSALSSSGKCGKNVTYTFDESTGLLTISGTGEMYYYDWDSSPFYNNSSIKTVVIENGVTSIGECAFIGCTGLTNVTIGNSVRSIGWSAFFGCTGLTSITIPDSVTSIGSSAFSGCTGLTSITIPDSVTSIGSSAFSGCTSLTSITIGNGVTSIVERAFSGCTSLTSIVVDKDNKIFDSRDNCNAIIKTSTNTLIIGCKNTVIPDSVTSIGDSAFYYCEGLTSITIPDSVTSIGSSAFSGCTGLTSITIPDSVTIIGNYAFSNCTSLANVTIGNSVASIVERAFSGCTSLTSIVVDKDNNVYDSRDNCNAIIKTSTNTLIIGCKNTVIPDSVTSIGNSAFSGCTSLTSITIPDSVTSIDYEAFYGCTGLKSVNITDISKWCSVAFANYYSNPLCCAHNLYLNGELVTDLIIPNSVTRIGGYAFSGCTSLTSVTIGNSVTSIGNSAFYNCTSLTSVTIGSGVTSIGSYAFSDCTGLTSVTIPDSVTSIGEGAFNNCTSLTSVTIPDSVTSIDSYAFYNCTGLTTITLGKGLTSISSYCFTNTNSTKMFFVYKDTYGETFVKNSGYEYSYLSEIDEEENIITEKINANFNWSIDKTTKTLTINCTNSMVSFENETAPWLPYKEYFNKVIISDGCKNIGTKAFQYCDKVESIQIPESVTSFGDSVFKYCFSLKEISIPEAITAINPYTFYSCVSLKTAVIPDNVTDIGEYSFYNCGSLADIIIPDSVKTIGNCAYYGCNSAKTIKTGNGVTSIGDNAFYSCSNAETVVIGNKVSNLGRYSFSYCSKIKEMTIPCSAVDTWSRYCFDGCSNIERIVITAGNGTMYDMNNDRNYFPWYASENSIKEIIIEDGVKNISNYAFIECTGLTSINIPGSVNTIGDYAFNGCSNLKDIVLPVSVSSIGKAAFTGCKNIGTITIYNKDCVINDEAITFYATLAGFRGSTTEEFCNKFGYPFIALDDASHEHTYSNACDDTCNLCGQKRTASPHVFDNECDTVCNICGFTRTAPHKDENNDGICDLCNEDCNGISAGQTKTVSVDSNNTTLLTFIPKDTGRYTFYTNNSSRFYGYIYDENMNRINSTNGYGFSISGDFTEGKAYYLGIRYYYSDYSGNVNVSLRCDYLACKHLHTEERAGIAATCTTPGYTSGVYCTDCDNWIEGHEYIDLAPHEFDNDCDKDCNNCDFTRNTSHKYGEYVVTTPADCGNDGVETSTCEKCGATRTRTIPVQGEHTFGEWVVTTQPTCATKGEKTRICSICHYEEKAPVDMVEHTYKQIIDTGDGYGLYICTHCNNLKYTEAESGSTPVTVCKHDYKLTIADATCNSKGKATMTCSLCGDTITADIPKKEHNYVGFVVAPTCEKAGYTRHVCSLCGDEYTDTPVEAKGHTMRVQTITPTCTQNGCDLHICSDCGYNYFDNEVAATGHTPIRVHAVDATADIDGYTGDIVCDVCNELIESGEVIPAHHEHSDKKVNSVSVSDTELNYKNTVTLTPVIDAESGAEYSIEYTSSDPSVAIIDNNGNITTKHKGSATITCTVKDENGEVLATDTCNVTVKFTFVQWLIWILLLGFLWY